MISFFICMFTVFFTITAHGTMTGKRIILFLVATVFGSIFLILLDKWCDRGADIKSILNNECKGKVKIVDIIAFIVIIGFSLAIRLAFLDFETEDGMAYFAYWISQFRELGVKTSLGACITEYAPLYTTVLTLLSLLPIKALTIVKIVPIVCDFVVGLAALRVYSLYKGDEATVTGKVAVLFIALLNPISVLNSSAWGQIDSVYACFLIFGLYFLSKNEKEGDRYSDIAVIMFALAFSVKLQAVFTLPVLLYFYVAKRRTQDSKGVRLSQFVWFPVVYFASAIPMFLCGKTLRDIFLIYARQTGKYNDMLTMRYYNFYTLIGDKLKDNNFDGYFSYGMIMAVAVLFMFYYLTYKKEVALNILNLLHIAVVTVLTLNFFLPSMHERYAYVAEVSIVILACLKKKYIIPSILTVVCTLSAYGDYLTMGELRAVIPAYLVAIIRLLVLSYLIFDLIKKDKEPVLEGPVCVNS